MFGKQYLTNFSSLFK